MRLRLALGALVAVAAVALGVWPALAAFPPTAGIDKPSEGVTWAGGDNADFHVTGTAATDSGNVITKVTAFADPPPGDKGTHHYKNEQTWSDTAASRAFDIQIFPDFNGKYRITVIATGKACNILGCGSDTNGPTSAPRNITLAVPPKTPEGVKATLSSGKVTFEWKANNTEGDLLGYLVERDLNGGDYTCLTSVSVDPTPGPTYSIVDNLADEPSGDYQWRVRAIRKSDSDSQMSTCSKAGTGIVSPVSQRALIRWANPTATTTSSTVPPGGTTTTTTKPKSPGGPGAGGSTGTAPPSRRPNLSALGGLSVTNNLARPPAQGLESDPGFNELLPFKAPADSSAEDGGSALPQTPLPASDSGNGSTTTLLFIAAGLLVTVLSMHVLWLKAQVDRMPLEPLVPVDAPLA